MLRADCHHQRASGACLGGMVAGMRRPPRAPFALEGLRQHRQADGIIPLKMLIAIRMRLIANSPLTPIQTGGQFVSPPSSVSVWTSQHRLNGYVPRSEANAACVEDERALPTPRRYLGGDPGKWSRSRRRAAAPHANSGAVEAPNISPWGPESAKARPPWWRAGSPGPSLFSQQFRHRCSVEPCEVLRCHRDHHDPISIHNKYRKSANDYLSQNSGRNLTAKWWTMGLQLHLWLSICCGRRGYIGDVSDGYGLHPRRSGRRIAWMGSGSRKFFR